jgi:hypothetical protein
MATRIRTTYRTLADIKSIPLPERTDSYTPVDQASFFKEACDRFEFRGYTLNNETHMVHRKHPIFISKIDVQGPDLPNDGRMKWTVAMMNSYNKTIANRIIFGGTVYVCTNGMIVADHVLRTKHTAHVWDRLPNMIDEAVAAFGYQVNKANDFYEDLKKVNTSTEQLASFAVDLGRKGLLHKPQVIDFYEECVKPSFDYQTPDLCLWNLHAAYTHLAKTLNPVERPQRVLGFEKALSAHYANA